MWKFIRKTLIGILRVIFKYEENQTNEKNFFFRRNKGGEKFFITPNLAEKEEVYEFNKKNKVTVRDFKEMMRKNYGLDDKYNYSIHQTEDNNSENDEVEIDKDDTNAENIVRVKASTSKRH